MRTRAPARRVRRNRRPDEIAGGASSRPTAPSRHPILRPVLAVTASLLVGGGVGVAAFAGGTALAVRTGVVTVASDVRGEIVPLDVANAVPEPEPVIAAAVPEPAPPIIPSGGGAAAHEASDTFTRRPYIAIGAGAARVEPRSPSAALTVAEDTSPAFEIGLGYDLSRWLSLELHAADLGAAEIDFLGTDVGDLGYQVYGASALFYLFNTRDGFVPFSSSRAGAHRREGLSAFGRFGIGGLLNDSDRVAYRRDYATHAVFGAGLEYGFRNGVALRAELQGFDTDARYLGLGVLKRFGSVSPAAAAVPAVEPPAAVPPPPAPEPPAEPVGLDPLDMPIVYFLFDRSELTARARETLDAFVRDMEGDERVIAIDGHTDWIGPEVYNEGLSDRRADVVRDYLVAAGMEPSRLIARGFGETQPITRNTTEEGRSLNRRAEIRPEE